jgi:hypothetical protein
VLARLPKILIVLSLAGSIGLHWAFLQAVAWTGMIVSYSQNAPLTEAMAKTFDGKHPCKLCKQIATEKKSEHKQDAGFQIGKLEFSYAPVEFIFCAPALFWKLGDSARTLQTLIYSPAVPPPRAFSA